MLETLETAGSALTAQRLRMDVIASNLANSEATSTPDGGPYKRERVVFGPALRDSLNKLSSSSTSITNGAASGGVEVKGIVQDQEEPRMVFDPTHPDANEDGFVAYPNVDMVTEMTDMLSASRSYEANITVVNVAKSMAQRALDIGR
ncbi:MAG TPA: flagellar basal body rod protein FlgC [Chloroflexota bacterium]|nr:flagellar basal body rod protein FlgC [Chloroflexota bacterium]